MTHLYPASALDWHAGVCLTSNGGLEFESGTRDVLGEGREVYDVLQVGGP